MWSEALDKTVITGNWQIFLKNLFDHFIHHKKILKVTKFQFKIICRSNVLDKNIPLRYIVPHPTGSNSTVLKKIQKQPPEVQKQSPEVFCK